MSKIEWTEKTWNPIYGCDKISHGCKNCYAEKVAGRISNMEHGKRYLSVVEKKTTPDGTILGQPKWNGKVDMDEDVMFRPLYWKKPTVIFPCSMGDLFHEDVPFEWIEQVWDIMARTGWHTYLVLTKRPEVMKRFAYNQRDKGSQFMLPNVWLGVTTESQKFADERIPILLDIPAVKYFVSVEPMLGYVNINQYMHDSNCNEVKGPHGCICSEPREVHLNWVICGGESGPKARPIHPTWVRSLRDQCIAANVPFFFKQWGEWYPDNDVSNKRYKGVSTISHNHGGHDVAMHKIGKKKAGRQLDGKIWEERP